MKNVLGREIPNEVLANGKEVFQGQYYRDNYAYTKDAPHIRAHVKPTGNKIVPTIKDAIVASGLSGGRHCHRPLHERYPRLSAVVSSSASSSAAASLYGSRWRAWESQQLTSTLC